MRHLLLTTTLCLVATTAWAGGEYHAPVASPASAAPSYTTNAPSAAATSHSQSSSVSKSNANANTGPVTVNNSTTPGYSGGGYNGPRYPTPDAIAPSIVTANECALPRSFGISAIFAGLSGGWATESESCKRLRLARSLSENDPATAREVKCLEDDMRRAAYSSGHPCRRDVRGWDTK